MGDGVADDTAAIQGAIDAAEAASGGIVFFPAGTYLVTSPLDFASGLNGLVLLGSGRIQCEITSASSDVVNIQGSRHVITGLRFRSQSGGGHIFNQVGTCTRCTFRDVTFRQDNDGSSIWQKGAADGGLNECLWDDFDSFHTSSATVPSWDLTGASGNAVNVNEWRRFRHDSTGDYAWRIDNTSTEVAHDNSWKHGRFQSCDNGCIDLRGSRAGRIWDCAVYNSNPASVPFRLRTSTGGEDPQFNVLDSVQRRGGTLGVGIVDVLLESGSVTTDTIIENPGNVGGDTFAVDLDGNRAVVLGGNVSLSNDALATRIARGRVRLDEFIEYRETSAPGAGPADAVRVFAFDNGGTQELRAVFGNGTVKTLATDT